MIKIPQLLIAAGESKRMGKPKQLLKWKNYTLIEHQIKNLLDTDQNVWVILGAHSEVIIPIINNYPINISLYENSIYTRYCRSFWPRSYSKPLNGFKTKI